MTAYGRSDRVVAVASDGSALVGQNASMEAVLHQYSALIRDIAGLRTVVLPRIADDPQQLHTTLSGLPSSVGAVFLPYVTPERAHMARLAAGETPVVTEHDTTAIALTAAVLTTLTHAGRPMNSSRVVVVGADTLPMLSPLLVTTGIGDITTWNRADAPAFPLHRITTSADAVIDLLDGRTAAFDIPHAPAVITRDDDPRVPLLALPGLLRALSKVRGATPNVEVCHACVFALVMTTPPELRLPHGPDRVLTSRVADAATRALHHPHDTRSN